MQSDVQNTLHISFCVNNLWTIGPCAIFPIKYISKFKSNCCCMLESAEQLDAERSAHLAVAADSHCGQQSGEGGEDPPCRHNNACVSQAKFTVQTQGVCDGVPALQGDGC